MHSSGMFRRPLTQNMGILSAVFMLNGANRILINK
jgi:hypothetical protein